MHWSLHFLFILTQRALWIICKEEGGSVSKFYKDYTSGGIFFFKSQIRLYEYNEDYLQSDQWSVQIIQKTFVKWIDEQGLYWIKIFPHLNVLFTFGWNWCSKGLHIQCNSVSTGSSILLISFWVKWIAPHTNGAVHIMLNVGLNW